MKAFLKYLITILVGLAGVAGVVISKDIFGQTQLVNVLHILCDGFFVMGVVLTGFGALIFTSNEGAFDMMAFGLQSFWDLFRKERKLKGVTYYDYQVARSEKKLKFGFILICGLAFLAVAVVFFLLYQQHV